MLFCDVHAIQRPPRSQSHECRSVPVAIVRDAPPVTAMTANVSPRTNAISRPSGDQIADFTPRPPATTGCDVPPRAEATEAPPRVR